MKRNTRSAIALVAATTLVAMAAAVAQAAPIDIADDDLLIPKANTLWKSSTSDPAGFNLDEATIYADTVDPADPEGGVDVNGDAFDGALQIWVEETSYGVPNCAGECTYVVDVTTSGGDTVVQGPAEVLSGLTVSVQHRFYAAGELARVLATYTNPTGAPITVATGAFSDYGSNGHTTVEADSSGDGDASNADHWMVTSDEGGGDPVVTTAWSKPGAAKLPSYVGLGVDGLSTDESLIEFSLTVQPGLTVSLAYFVKIHGYTVEEDEPFSIGEGGELAAAALIADDFAAAVAAAAADASEFSTFSGRLIAGLAPGTVVLNWGTVGGTPPPADPARPATGRPTFTG